jgi:hypothetical protein
MLPGVVKPVFIICFDEEKTNFEAALQMRAQLRDICETAEVFAWMPRLENIHRLLETSAEEKVRITRFGHPENVMDWGYLIEDKLERLARKAHEDYRESELKKIDGRRMPVWEELTVESLYRRSNEQQALHIDTKLSVIGLKRVDVSKLAGRPQAEISKEDAQLLAEIEHNRWMGERLMGGWRYGAVRNDAARIHWNLVPYGALDKDTRDKDLKPCMEIPNSLREVDECVVRI